MYNHTSFSLVAHAFPCSHGDCQRFTHDSKARGGWFFSAKWLWKWYVQSSDIRRTYNEIHMFFWIKSMQSHHPNPEPRSNAQRLLCFLLGDAAASGKGGPHLVVQEPLLSKQPEAVMGPRSKKTLMSTSRDAVGFVWDTWKLTSGMFWKYLVDLGDISDSFVD